MEKPNTEVGKDALNDEDLFEAHLRGDTSAFPLIVQRYRNCLGGFVAKALGTQAAADEMQDIWLQAVRHASSFDRERGTVHAWLFAIAQHRIIDARRRHHREACASFLWKEAKRREMEGRERDAETVLDRLCPSDDHLEIRKAMLRLPPQQRNALILHLEGADNAKIAEKLDLSPHSVPACLSRARKAVREELSKKEGQAG